MLMKAFSKEAVFLFSQCIYMGTHLELEIYRK